ncbi:MAG TPA: hypothetical protein VGL99_17860 [Chloroflexota bacterium]|jgi:hypothetical protein
MFGTRSLQTAALALVLYGALGFALAVTLLVVGSTTLSQVATLQTTLERERSALVSSMRTAAATVRDTASATTDFQTSIATARTSADTASKLANDTAGTFRDMAASLNISIFGLQPLAGLSPQFNQGADQLQQLAISLGATRETLAVNRADVQRVATDLSQLQGQLDAVATALDTPGLLGLGSQTMLPFQVAFYGMCLFVALQSAFSVIAGFALYRLQAAMGSTPLFPFLAHHPALPEPAEVRMATTSGGRGPEHDRVRA